MLSTSLWSGLQDDARNLVSGILPCSPLGERLTRFGRPVFALFLALGGLFCVPHAVACRGGGEAASYFHFE